MLYLFALQLVKPLEHGQMRLDGEQHILSALAQIAQDLGQIRVSAAARHHRAVFKIGVLYMHVIYMVPQYGVIVDGLFAALDEVRRVEYAFESAAEVRDQVKAAGSDIAVYALFVFVAERDARLIRRVEHSLEA